MPVTAGAFARRPAGSGPTGDANGEPNQGEEETKFGSMGE